MKALYSTKRFAPKFLVQLFAVILLFPPLLYAQIDLTADTQHPALFLVGDSIMHTGVAPGDVGPWGWGAEIIPMFDATKIHVYNEGLGGRSSRGYIQEGAWAKIMDHLQPGDWVIVHFGHNDAANSQNYPDRTTIKGNGDDTEDIDSPVTHQKETIHSYGWYLRQYVRDAKSKGANVIICSPPPAQYLGRWQDPPRPGRICRLGCRGGKAERRFVHRFEYNLRRQVRCAGTRDNSTAVQRQPAQPKGGRAPECRVCGDGDQAIEYSAGEGPCSAAGFKVMRAVR